MSIKIQHILLASHGTPGAMAAVQAALALCQTHGQGTGTIHHLVVVPDLWKGMTGDDWLNNGSTRDRYRRYLESTIGSEVDEHCNQVRQEAETQGIQYSQEIRVGKPDQSLLDCCANREVDLVVMGSPRPKGIPGLRSRMHMETLAKSLSVPFLVVPFPHQAQ